MPSRLRLRRVNHTSRPARAITAAAARVTDPGKDLNTKVSSNAGGDWTEKAWEFVGLVGELDYYVRWRSNANSRARLIAVAIDPTTGDQSPLEEDSPNAALISGLVRSIGGEDQSQILKRLTTFLTVPGEGYVAFLIDPKTRTESWVPLSRKEIKKQGQQLVFVLPDESKHEYNPDIDMLFRIWDADPQQAWIATSPVKANLPVLQEIVSSTRSIDNANNSRLIGKGIVVIDDAVNLPTQKSPVADRETNPPVEPEMLQASEADIQDLLYEVATTAYKDDKSMAAMAPVFMTVSGVKPADAMQHFKFDTEVSQTALETRERAIKRLALGLEVSPERLLGLSTSNHWNAWMVTEDDVKVHLVPPLVLIAAAFTRQVLRPALEVLGINPELYAIGVDTTEMTQDPDRKSEALAAHARGAITNAALRRYLGFSDEDGYDLSTMEGWKELARDKAAFDPAVWATVAQIAAPDDAPLPPMPEPAALPATPAPAPAALPAESAPASTSAAASKVLIEMCTQRAVELAGKRMLTRSNRGLVPEGTPPAEYHQHLLPPAPNEVLRLIAGWDTLASGDLLTTAGVDRARLIRIVEAAAINRLTRGR